MLLGPSQRAFPDIHGHSVSNHARLRQIDRQKSMISSDIRDPAARLYQRSYRLQPI
jgi:hypothetical protein